MHLIEAIMEFNEADLGFSACQVLTAPARKESVLITDGDTTVRISAKDFVDMIEIQQANATCPADIWYEISRYQHTVIGKK